MVGAMIIVAVSLVAGGIIGLRIMVEKSRVPINAESMCPIAGPVAFTSILVDGTDTFSPVQVADLQRYFLEFKDSLYKHEQVAIYAPREMSSEQLLRPTLKICSPGDAKGVGGLTANPQAIQRKYERDFLAQIDKALGHSLDAQGSATSPIMEMIQAVVIDSFPIQTTAPKRLIIVSDMLQNSDYYSHYRDPISFDVLQENPEFQHVSSNLSGVDVEILYIGRKGAEELQTNRHGLFWEAFVRHMRGNLRSIRRIGG